MVEMSVIIKSAKVITLVLGLAIVIVGYHSHFQSSWVKSIPLVSNDGYEFKVKPYRLCGVKGIWKDLRDSKCPPISMEHYFITVVILTFGFSAALFIAGFRKVDLESGTLRNVDLGYHAIAAVMLFVAGILYIMSANQISNLKWGDLFNEAEYKILNYRKSEKIAAGVLTIVHSILYGAIAVLIGKKTFMKSS